MTTSVSGFSRLAYSLGEHGQLPRSFGRLSRRAHVSPYAIFSAAIVSSAIVIATTSFKSDDVAFLASLFSFGVLLAFTAAQLAVIKLRIDEPDLPRPYRAPFSVTIRGGDIPLPAIVGSVGDVRGLDRRDGDAPGRAVRRPAVALAGLVIFVSVRLSHGEGLMERVEAPTSAMSCRLAQFKRILVPMKLGVIGEEMLATAVKLASEHEAEVQALHVIRVPLELPLDAPMLDEEERAEASLAEAKLLGADFGVTVEGTTVRARAIGDAIVAQAEEVDADLIVLGSAPRWRRAVAVLLADGRLRAPQRALRGADRRLPADRAGRGARGHLTAASRRSTLRRCEGDRDRMRARRLGRRAAAPGSGWDVTVSTRTRTRSGGSARAGPAGSSSVTGWTSTLLREAGIEEADAVVVTTDGDNTNLVIAQAAQKQFEVPTVIVRVLDPARAQFYATRGCASSARRPPRSRRSSRRPQGRGGGRLMYVLIAGGGKVGANLTRSLLRAGTRGDADRAAAVPVRQARGRVRAPGDSRRCDGALRARARRHQAAARTARRRDGRRRGQHRHLPARAASATASAT